ncbi:hypothetical protein D3C72_2055380 [compost metagenome]
MSIGVEDGGRMSASRTTARSSGCMKRLSVAGLLSSSLGVMPSEEPVSPAA